MLLNGVGFAEHLQIAVPRASAGELGDGVGIRSRYAGDCHAVGDAGDERESGERNDDGANHVERGRRSMSRRRGLGSLENARSAKEMKACRRLPGPRAFLAHLIAEPLGTFKCVP